MTGRSTLRSNIISSRDMVQKGVVNLQYISIDEQIADILTKPLSKAKFVYFIDKLGVMQNVSLIEREC
jgi:hypothetical protein